MLTTRPVIVMQVPEQLTLSETREFMRDLDPLLKSHRPRIVLECAQVRSMHSNGVEGLLQCLEEALKRDGDVKLAALSREAKVILELLQVSGMFEIFTTTEEAVRSFNAIRFDALPRVTSPRYDAVFGDAGAKRASSPI